MKISRPEIEAEPAEELERMYNTTALLERTTKVDLLEVADGKHDVSEGLDHESLYKRLQVQVSRPWPAPSCLQTAWHADSHRTEMQKTRLQFCDSYIFISCTPKTRWRGVIASFILDLAAVSVQYWSRCSDC
jgi:hypothetical protein